jgi:50S ribosomal subunit-associated GTPase HflX
MKKNKPQETNNHPTQITITNKFDALRHAKGKGNTKHERKDSAQPPIFVSGITNKQRLTATSEQVVNRLNYALKITYSDTIKVITNKVEYHKTIIDIIKRKTFNSTHTNLNNNVRAEW